MQALDWLTIDMKFYLLNQLYTINAKVWFKAFVQHWNERNKSIWNYIFSKKDNISFTLNSMDQIVVLISF